MEPRFPLGHVVAAALVILLFEAVRSWAGHTVEGTFDAMLDGRTLPARFHVRWGHFAGDDSAFPHGGFSLAPRVSGDVDVGRGRSWPLPSARCAFPTSDSSASWPETRVDTCVVVSPARSGYRAHLELLRTVVRLPRSIGYRYSDIGPTGYSYPRTMSLWIGIEREVPGTGWVIVGSSYVPHVTGLEP